MGTMDTRLCDLGIPHHRFPRCRYLPMILDWQFTVHPIGAAGGAEGRDDIVFLENLLMENTVIREPGTIHLPTGCTLSRPVKRFPDPLINR